MEPPVVRMPPERSVSKPNRPASQVSTVRSMTLAAGESCQKLQFWFNVAATASA